MECCWYFRLGSSWSMVALNNSDVRRWFFFSFFFYEERLSTSFLSGLGARANLLSWFPFYEWKRRRRRRYLIPCSASYFFACDPVTQPWTIRSKQIVKDTHTYRERKVFFLLIRFFRLQISWKKIPFATQTEKCARNNILHCHQHNFCLLLT